MEKENKPPKKEIYQSLKKIIIPLVVIIIAVFASFATFYILQFSLNTQTPVVVVSSGSMSPTINEGDLLFVKGEKGSEIQNGSIIVFQGTWYGAPAEPIVHRVIDIYLDGDGYWFYTKGDNNLSPDPLPTNERYVYGVVIGGIPYIGWIKLFFDRTGLLYLFIVIIILYLIISIVLDYFKEKESHNTSETEKKIQKIKKNEDS